MKKFVIDADANIMMFDGKKLKTLGTAHPLSEVIKDKLYAFGDDLYLKSDDEYKLLAENAKVYHLGNPIWHADQQFSRLSFDDHQDMFVYLDLKDYNIKSFSPEYIHIFYPDDVLQPRPNMVIIQKEQREHLMCVCEKDEFYILDDKAIGNEKNFFWHGGVYTYLNNAFVRVPIVIEYLNNIFMIIRNDTYKESTFVVCADGNIDYLGTFNGILKTAVSTVLSTHNNGFDNFWHLDNNSIRRIIASIAGKDTVEVLQDGYIIHHYKTDVGSDNGGIINGTTVYHLNSNGNYTPT